MNIGLGVCCGITSIYLARNGFFGTHKYHFYTNRKLIYASESFIGTTIKYKEHDTYTTIYSIWPAKVYQNNELVYNSRTRVTLSLWDSSHQVSREAVRDE